MIHNFHLKIDKGKPAVLRYNPNVQYPTVTLETNGAILKCAENIQIIPYHRIWLILTYS